MDKTEQSIFEYVVTETINEIIPPGEIEFIAFIKELFAFPDEYITNAIKLNEYVNMVLFAKILKANENYPHYFKDGTQYKYWFDNVVYTALHKVSANITASEKFVEIMQDMQLINPIFHNNLSTKRTLAIFEKRLSRSHNRIDKLHKPILVWEDGKQNELAELSRNISQQKITATKFSFKNVFFPSCIPIHINKGKLKKLAYLLFVLYSNDFFTVKNAANNKGYQKAAAEYFGYYSGKVPSAKYFTKILSRDRKLNPETYNRLILYAKDTVMRCTSKKVLFPK